MNVSMGGMLLPGADAELGGGEIEDGVRMDAHRHVIHGYKRGRSAVKLNSAAMITCKLTHMTSKYGAQSEQLRTPVPPRNHGCFVSEIESSHLSV